mgnify:FL=1|jgi:uncharacterized protein (DUF58 family)
MSIITKELFKNIRRIQIRTNRAVDDMLVGSYHSVFKGRGVEFEDVREYQPGDEVRSIDWNVTAKMNFPYIKNFREERELTVMIIVDISPSSFFGTTGKQKNELAAEIAAVLAFSAIKNNDRVGMILFSGGVEKYIPPQKGVKHVLRMVRELLTAETSQKTTNIAAALDFFGKVQKRRAICFLLSDFITADYSRSCAIAAKRHDLIALCLTDPKERTPPKAGVVTLKDLETGKERIIDMSREAVRTAIAGATKSRLYNNRKLMEKVGAGFVDIDTEGEYCKAIRDYFVMRERRR